VPPTRGGPALAHPPGPRTAPRRAPAASPDRGPDSGAGRVRGAEWTVGLAAAVAIIDFAIAFDAFVLRPLLTRGDPRGVVRVAVVLGAIALAAKLRHGPHPVPAAAGRHAPNGPGPTPEPHTAPPRPNVAPPMPSPTAPDTPLTAPASARRDGLDVQVLCPVVVHGAAGALTAKSVELVVYLACHPEGIHEERIKAALWPAREPRPQTWLNRVSGTRKGLGRSADGALLLPWFEQHVGRLGPSVQTDVDALVAARSRAEHQATTEAAATLTQALEVVRGRPFDMATGYEWAFTELHVAHAERVVVDVAHDLAGLALTLGDWRRTLWATDVGLRACPASELLYQDRMRACAAAGDRRGIESALRDLRRTLAAADSADVPSRDTVELYEQLHARLQRGAPAEPTPDIPRPVTPR
jgi:DNA-binding SARP family transcriptional activator